MASGAASGPTETPSLTIERNYGASPQQVWQAWTDPQALIRWFGPEETESVMQSELDVRVGGRYRTARRNHLRVWTEPEAMRDAKREDEKVEAFKEEGEDTEPPRRPGRRNTGAA